jgi:hypothetical protein
MDRTQDRANGAAAARGRAGRPGLRIDVADVEPASAPLPEVPYCAAVDALIVPPVFGAESCGSTSIEGCSDAGGWLIPSIGFHAGLTAVHLAFDQHRPLVLSPDIVWMFIVQGFALHVEANAETLRLQFVSHSGQIELEVQRDEFIKGAPTNDWACVFDEFSAQIGAHIGAATHALLEPRFSTTGAVERTAAQVVLLEAMQYYFSYNVRTLCGIPYVVVEGTPEDWASLAQRAEGLAGFGLEWWIDGLRPILAEFVAAARGAVRREFWQAIYKRQGGSGGPYISGWITMFFPYLRRPVRGRDTSRNPHLDGGGARLREMLSASGPAPGGLTCGVLPSGLAGVPFEWRYWDETYAMRFVAGFVGVRQDAQTLAVRPEIGWAVYEPAQVEAAYAARVEARERASEEKAERDRARANAWTWKGLCASCGFWLYGHDDEPLRTHCGRTLVEVLRRQ